MFALFEDYGDLFVDVGVNFPTTEADNGARHTIVSGVFLGASVDPDNGTLTSVDATADDNTVADDEDGVTLVSNVIVANSTVEFDIFATDSAGVGATLDVWIDFNDDGDWTDPGEAFLNTPLVSGSTTTRIFETPADVAPSGALLAARFRWGTGSDSFEGAAASGEVEDYLFPTNALVGQEIEAADFNGDGFINEADHDTWQADFGSTSGLGLRSDGNNSGVVDLFDYILWREAFDSAPATIIQPPTPGDYNADGAVDGDDHAAFATTIGSSVDPGTGADGNGDGVVNAADFVVWRESEVSSGAAVALLSLPEPESPAVASSIVVDASTAITLQAVTEAPVVDSAFAVEAPAEIDADGDSEAFDLALLQLAAGDAVQDGDEREEADGAPLSEEDEADSIELALEDGLLSAI